jgi:hypothetical protein
MKKAEDYSSPRSKNQYLPLVYGDMSSGGEGGLWQAVNLDIDNRVYALAGCPLLSQAAGNQVSIFNRDGDELGPGFTFNHSHDFQGKGAIATVTFPQLTASDISVSADDNSFNSTTSDLSIFGENWRLTSEGFSQTTNNSNLKIVSADANKLVVEGRDLKDEAAGAEVNLIADQQRNEPLALRAKGKADGSGNLITSPISLVRDLLTNYCGVPQEELDPTAFSRAWSRAEVLGLAAAGVIVRPVKASSLLTEILGEFLGSWWRGGDGRLRFYLDLGPGSADEAELASVLYGTHLRQVSVSAKLSQMVNQAQARYCYNQVLHDFEADYDGAGSKDTASQGIYGEQQKELELKWVRSQSVVLTLCQRLVGLLAQPRRIISCEEDALVNLPLEKGDAALFNLEWLYDRGGRPLVNQIVRMLGIEPQFDQGTIRFTLLDTGFYKTIACLADGSHQGDGDCLAGGERDLRPY